MKLFSFRGDHEHLPENTLLAFQQALQNGAEGISMEVHMSRDREPILYRDESLSRLTDAVGLVRHHDLSEIQEANFNEPYTKYHQHIPSLRDYLAWAEPLPHTTILVLKNDSFYTPNLEEEVMKRINASQSKDRVVIATARLESLRLIHSHYPEAHLAWIPDKLNEESLETLQELKITWIVPALTEVTPQMVSFCHEKGLHLLVRVVSTESQVQQMQEFGVDAVLTKDITMARESLSVKEMPFSPDQLTFLSLENTAEDSGKLDIQSLAQRAKQLAGKKSSKGSKGNTLAVILSMVICVVVASLATGLLMNIFKKIFH